MGDKDPASAQEEILKPVHAQIGIYYARPRVGSHTHSPQVVMCPAPHGIDNVFLLDAKPQQVLVNHGSRMVDRRAILLSEAKTKVRQRITQSVYSRCVI